MEEITTNQEEITFQCYNSKIKQIEEHSLPLQEFLLHAKTFDSVHPITCPICNSIIENKQYIRNGEWNTQLEKVTYQNGKKVGLYERYYSNGNLYERSHYDDNGKLNGLCEFWYDTTGKKMKHMNYVNGKLDGIYKYWYQDGILFESYEYQNGVRL